MKSFKNHSRFLAMVLSLVMCLGLCQPAFAAGDNVLKTVPGTWPSKHLDITCNEEPADENGQKYVVATCYDPVFTFKGHTVGNGPEDGITVTGNGSGYTIKATKPGVYQVFVKSDYTYDLSNTVIPEICPSCGRKFSKTNSSLYHYTAEENFTVTADYTLSYDLNRGEGDISGATKTVAATSADFAVTSAVPTREGYEFTGWKVSDGTLKDGVVTVTWPKTEAKLTAQWKEVEKPEPEQPKHEHTMDWTVTEYPTCTEKGNRNYACTDPDCNYVENNEEIPATGHNYDRGITQRTSPDWKEPTCTEPGNYVYLCNNYANGVDGDLCHFPKSESQPALGHHLVNDAAVAATCYDSGLTAGKHCDRNGCTYVETAQKVTPALAPDYEGSKWVENGEAATGHHRDCVNCNGGATGHREFKLHNFGEGDGWKIVARSGWYADPSDPAHMYQTVTVERTCVDCAYTETDVVKYKDTDHKGVDDDELIRDKEAKSFVVYYVGSDGKNLDSYTVNLKEGEAAVKVESKSFTGYTFDRADRDEIAYSDTVATVYVYYTLNRHTLTVNYVYADGLMAALPHTESVAYGNGYSVTSPVLVGFNADRLVVAGTMGDEDVTVTVVYVAEVEQGQNPDNRTPVDNGDETIPDDETPTTQAPEEEEIVEDEIPMIDAPAAEEPAAEEPAAEEIIEDDVPLADVPKTGDLSAIWYAATALSALGLTVLGRKKEENDD